MSNSEKVFYKYRPKHVHVHTYKQTISPKHYVKRKVYLKILLYYLLILMSFQGILNSFECSSIIVYLVLNEVSRIGI